MSPNRSRGGGGGLSLASRLHNLNPLMEIYASAPVQRLEFDSNLSYFSSSIVIAALFNYHDEIYTKQ